LQLKNNSAIGVEDNQKHIHAIKASKLKKFGCLTLAMVSNLRSNLKHYACIMD